MVTGSNPEDKDHREGAMETIIQVVVHTGLVEPPVVISMGLVVQDMAEVAPVGDISSKDMGVL